MTPDGYAVAADVASIAADRGFFVKLGPHEARAVCAGEQVHAIDNACPHAGGSLAEGNVVDGCVTCPLHGWKFDTCSGAAIVPARPGVTSYPTRIENGKVLVQLGSRPT